MNHNRTLVTVIIPTYNSVKALQKNLPVLLEYVQKSCFEFEIIIVDDGSADLNETKAIAGHFGCVYYRVEKNMGKGNAVRKGVELAKGRYIIFTDSDIPYNLNAIDRILYYLDNKEYHLAIGDRRLKNSVYYENISYLRKVASRCFTFLIGGFVTGGYFDTQCGIKGFQSNVAKKLFSASIINGFAFDVEIVYLALKYNLEIRRVPVVLRCSDGKSVSVFKHGITMLIDTLRIKWNFSNKKYQIDFDEQENH